MQVQDREVEKPWGMSLNKENRCWYIMVSNTSPCFKVNYGPVTLSPSCKNDVQLVIRVGHG